VVSGTWVWQRSQVVMAIVYRKQERCAACGVGGFVMTRCVLEGIDDKLRRKMGWARSDTGHALVRILLLAPDPILQSRIAAAARYIQHMNHQRYESHNPRLIPNKR
jgi:hypothetical protein